MTWWHYLLLVNLYLLLFYGFYIVLLRNETFFQLNRAYLVAGALLSFVIPVVQSEWIKQLFITQRVQQTIYSTIYHPEFVYQPKPAEGLTFTIGQILAVIYIGGAIFLLGRFFMQLLSVKKLIINLEASAAFSFFNKVKIDATLPGQQTIIEHEQVHVSQWHSADVLFIEAVMIINWFNPIVYFYRKTIKHVHEFIADKKAIERGTSKTEYAYLLLSQTFGANPHQLTNNFFNKSLLKRRIIMLNKDKSKRRKLLKYGLSAPLFAAMLILSSATVKNSRMVRLINKKTEQLFLMNTMPDKQTIKQVLITDQDTQPAPKIVQQEDNPVIDINEAPAPQEQTVADKTDKQDNENIVFSAVEVQPEFPGGETAFGKFLQANLRYPKLARESNVQGKVYVQFVVQKDGSLDDMKVLRDPGAGLGEEALRVLAMSPRWIPGIQNGNLAKVQYTIPVNFTLGNDNNMTFKTDTLRRVVTMLTRVNMGHAMGGGGRISSSTITMDTDGIGQPKPTAAKILLYKRTSDANDATFYVNGKELTPEQAMTIKPDKIENIRITGNSKDQANNDKLKKAVIFITLKGEKAERQ
ncbi:TonB family protein [Mucilaginibacter sp. AW1-3]